MKKTFAKLTAALLAAALLAACGATADTAAASESAAEPAAASDAAPAAPADTQGAAPADTAVADDSVAVNGVVLTPGGDAQAAIAALGDGYEYTENISCMFEGGLDKTYTYPDVTVYTFPTSDTEESILLVEVTGDSVTTGRGVKLGDSLDTALLTYTDLLAPDESDPDRYTATLGEVLFTLTAKDGVVTGITWELADPPLL